MTGQEGDHSKHLTTCNSTAVVGSHSSSEKDSDSTAGTQEGASQGSRWEEDLHGGHDRLDVPDVGPRELELDDLCAFSSEPLVNALLKPTRTMREQEIQERSAGGRGVSN